MPARPPALPSFSRHLLVCLRPRWPDAHGVYRSRPCRHSPVRLRPRWLDAPGVYFFLLAKTAGAPFFHHIFDFLYCLRLRHLLSPYNYDFFLCSALRCIGLSIHGRHNRGVITGQSRSVGIVVFPEETGRPDGDCDDGFFFETPVSVAASERRLWPNRTARRSVGLLYIRFSQGVSQL